MEVLLVMEPRLKVRMVRTMGSHRIMNSHQAMGSHPARDSHRTMGIPPATELLLVAKMALARDTLSIAEVVWATSILQAVEVMAVLLATVHPARGGLQATELTIITPRPHLSHLH